MKQSILLALALALPPCALLAADKNPDADFYKNAAEGGLAEVEIGKLAQDKAASAYVKEFGSMMVSDHTAANEKLKALAARKNVDLPTSPSISQMATRTKLQVLSGSTFDKSYVKGMIKDHKEDIEEFQKEATSGRDPEARAFAKTTLPTLETHLKKIQSIAAHEGIDAD